MKIPNFRYFVEVMETGIRLHDIALQIGLPASSCSHMARVKMADKPAPLIQSGPTVSETMLSSVNHIMIFYCFRVQHLLPK